MEYSVQETSNLSSACFTSTQRDFCSIQPSAIAVLHRQELQFFEKGDYYPTHF